MSTTSLRQAQIEEIVKCGKEPSYFMKKYVRIQHPVKGIIPFTTYKFQDDCVSSFKDHRLNIVLKARQLGLSTVAAAYAVWYAVFYRDKNILVIATKLSTAINFIKKVRIMIDNLPKWLLLPGIEPSKQSIRFTNGSSITAIPTSDDAGRSEALSLLIIDEAAFIKNFEDIWTGLYPTISTGGRAIILSTPNGVGGTYYRLWTEAEAGVNEFNPIRLSWEVHPEHGEEWFKSQTRNLPKRKIAQEYLCVGEDSRIITPDGYKLAKDIAVGDLVLTHKGRFKPVTKTKARLVDTSENLYQISSPGNRRGKFLVTGNHPALSYRFWANNESSLDYIVDTPMEPSWIDFDTIASKRKTTDRIVNVVFPKFDLPPQTLTRIDLSTLVDNPIDVTETSCRYHKQWGKTSRYVDVNFDLGKLVGLYLAEGCNARGGFDMGFHKDELNTHVKWVADYISSLGARPNIGESKLTNGCRLWTHNKHMGALVRLFVKGNVAHEKSLDMTRVMSAGKEFVKGLLYGHHAGDGNHKHKTKTSTYTTSSRLAYQLRTLNSAFNLYPRIGRVEFSKKNPLHHDMWNLEFQAEHTTYLSLLETEKQQYKKQSRTRFVNGHFVGSYSVEKVDFDIDGGVTVYDISVQDDRSFVVESAVLHNCDFISSGDTFLQPDALEAIRTSIKAPIVKEGPNNGVWIWSQPIDGHQYVISADVSRGDARDFSAFHVIDVLENAVAAEYMGKVPPEVLGELMVEYGKRYNVALLCPENNTFGYFTCKEIKKLGYRRLYYHGHKGDPFNYVPLDDTENGGFPTSPVTRVQILSKLEELIRTKSLKIYSQRLYDQLQSFIWNGNKPMASKDSYDDLVMSLAIGGWLIDGSSGVTEQAAAMAMAILASTKIERRNRSEMQEINSIQPLVNSQIRGLNPYNVHKPRDPSNVRHVDITDFSWLLR